MIWELWGHFIPTIPNQIIYGKTKRKGDPQQGRSSCFFKHELPLIIHELPINFLASTAPRFLAIYTAKAVRFLLNFEKATTLSRLKIEFHAQTATLSRLKIELHAQTATLCRLKIEFHVKTTTLCRLKIEMSLLEGTEMRPLRGRVGGKYIIAFFKHELPSIIHELP